MGEKIINPRDRFTTNTNHNIMLFKEIYEEIKDDFDFEMIHNFKGEVIISVNRKRKIS